MIRPSSADRIVACELSALETELPYNPESPEARLGSAKHAALAIVVHGCSPDCEKIAAQYGVPADDIDIAVACGRQIWRELSGYFPTPETESKVVGTVAKGTADVLQVLYDESGEIAHILVLEWKTGWGDTEHPAQLRSYALAAVEQHGEPLTRCVTCCEVHLAQREWVMHNFALAELYAWRDHLADLLHRITVSPKALVATPGSHCEYCPKQLDCQIRDMYLRSSVSALMVVDKDKAITREKLGELYYRAQDLERALRRYHEILQSALDSGPVQLPDGKRVELVPEKRAKIDAVGAIDSIAEKYGLDIEGRRELLGSITKSAIDRWAKSVAAKGKKAGLLRDVHATLREAGAMVDVEQRRRKVVG